jgi:hypothetical protein
MHHRGKAAPLVTGARRHIGEQKHQVGLGMMGWLMIEVFLPTGIAEISACHDTRGVSGNRGRRTEREIKN